MRIVAYVQQARERPAPLAHDIPLRSGRLRAAGRGRHEQIVPLRVTLRAQHCRDECFRKIHVGHEQHVLAREARSPVRFEDVGNRDHDAQLDLLLEVARFGHGGKGGVVADERGVDVVERELDAPGREHRASERLGGLARGGEAGCHVAVRRAQRRLDHPEHVGWALDDSADRRVEHVERHRVDRRQVLVERAEPGVVVTAIPAIPRPRTAGQSSCPLKQLRSRRSLPWGPSMRGASSLLGSVSHSGRRPVGAIREPARVRAGCTRSFPPNRPATGWNSYP